MNEMNQPPAGGDPQDFWPTEEIGPSAGPARPGWGQSSARAGQAGQGWSQAGPGSQPRPGWGQSSARAGQAGQGGGHGGGQRSGPGSPPRPARRHGRALWWGAGLALVALLAGGAVAATSLSGSSSPAPAGPSGQAAQLNAILSSASSSSSAAKAASFGASGPTATANTQAHPCLNRAARLRAAGHPDAARIVLGLCRHPLARLRLLGGIHGQFTFETKNGPRTLAYERGTIESVSGSDVVVQATDGTTWTWVLQSNTVIRQDRKPATASALSEGERVFVGGPVVSGTYDARLLVIRPTSSSPTPSPSPGSASGS